MNEERVTQSQADCQPSLLQRIGNIAVAREVKIMKVENGFILSIGCKTFVSNSFNNVVENLARYYDNPAQAEKDGWK